MRGATPFADVATDAGANDVVPSRIAAATTGQDMIKAEFVGSESPAAILAAVAVAGENVAPVELHSGLGEAIIRQEPDDPRHQDFKMDRADEIVLGLSKAGTSLGNLAPALEVIGLILTVVECDDLGQILK